ncbi:MAG: alanine:cation symporter family protein [Phocaeicola vulgatus]
MDSNIRCFYRYTWSFAHAQHFIILFSGLASTGEANGIKLTQMALNNEIGNIGTIYVAVAILFFAYSSILGNYYYGEANVRYITRRNAGLSPFTAAAVCGMVMFGALGQLWNWHGAWQIWQWDL